MNFFDWPLYVLYLGWEVKNDVSGQSQDVLRVWMSKLENLYWGRNGAQVCDFQLVAPGVKWSEFFSHLAHSPCMPFPHFLCGPLPNRIFWTGVIWYIGNDRAHSNGAHIWHLFVKCQRGKHLGYGGGSQKNINCHNEVHTIDVNFDVPNDSLRTLLMSINYF